MQRLPTPCCHQVTPSVLKSQKNGFLFVRALFNRTNCAAPLNSNHIFVLKTKKKGLDSFFFLKNPATSLHFLFFPSSYILFHSILMFSCRFIFGKEENVFNGIFPVLSLPEYMHVIRGRYIYIKRQAEICFPTCFLTVTLIFISSLNDGGRSEVGQSEKEIGNWLEQSKAFASIELNVFVRLKVMIG